MKYLFFWGGIYSNWYKSPIRIDGMILNSMKGIGLDTLGREFNCAEQAMMFYKALFFGDHEVAEKIMKQSDPKRQKKLGREIKNFNPYMWDIVKVEIVSNIVLQKFKQNSELKKQLLKEDCKIFVEASPYDRIWGIGFDATNAMAHESEWGENLLGKIITKIRNNLKE